MEYRFSALLESRGQSLLDLSLYVSSDNYNNTTARAYAALLQWPNQWIIPPRIRSKAKERTEHLGLSSLDLDAAEEERKQGRDANAIAANQIPKSLVTKPRQTVSGLLGQTAQKSRIRLQGLTAGFVEPLQELLGKKRYLLSDDIPSSLDCLALGYLSLALVPELPFPWLRDDIMAQAPRLAAYVKRLEHHCFGDAIDSKALLSGTAAGAASRLPWQVPPKISLAGVGLCIVEGIADSIPVVKDIRLSRRIRQMGRDTSLESQQVTALAEVHKREALTSAATVVLGVGMFVFYMVKVGLLSIRTVTEDAESEPQEAPPADSRFGEAGALLGLSS